MSESKKSFCRFCHVYCGVEVEIENNKVLKVRGDKENPISQGYTCIKGRAETDRINHPDRLLQTQKRVAGRLKPINNEKALDEVSEKLKAIIDEHGPRSVATYIGCGGHRTSAGSPMFVRKWMDALGSPSFYTSYTVDSPALSVAVSRMFGAPLPLPLFDMDNAEVAMFVATNPVVSHLWTMPQSNPSTRLKQNLKRGMKLVVIDPRKTEVAKAADIHLQVKPGEDATLLAGMIKIIIEENLFDKDYVKDYVSGFEDLYEAVKDFGLEYVSQRTQIPADLIHKGAVMYASAKSGAATTGTGLHMARHQNTAVQLVMTINALCGRYDRRGGFTRIDGTLAPPLPENSEPMEYPLYTGEESRIRGIKGINGLLGYAEMPSNTLTDEILTPGEGQIKALIVNGGNPALVFPDAEATHKALESLGLLVVNDLFESPTARYADYIFAAKHPFEREDVPSLMDAYYPAPFGQYTDKLIDAPEGTIEEWEVYFGLAQRLGIEMDLPGVDMKTKPNFEEVIHGLHPQARVSMEELRKYPSGALFGDVTPKVGGVVPSMIAHPDKRMAAGHPEMLADLRRIISEPIIEAGGYETSEDFEFRLITYRMREVYCSSGQNLPTIQNRWTYNPLLMHPEDVKRKGLNSGQIVMIDSGFGQVQGVVEVTDEVKQGVVGLAHGWGDPNDKSSAENKGSNVQHLIPDHIRFDPVTGLAQQSAIPVNIGAA